MALLRHLCNNNYNFWWLYVLSVSKWLNESGKTSPAKFAGPDSRMLVSHRHRETDAERQKSCGLEQYILRNESVRPEFNAQANEFFTQLKYGRDQRCITKLAKKASFYPNEPIVAIPEMPRKPPAENYGMRWPVPRTATLEITLCTHTIRVFLFFFWLKNAINIVWGQGCLEQENVQRGFHPAIIGFSSSLDAKH